MSGFTTTKLPITKSNRKKKTKRVKESAGISKKAQLEFSGPAVR